MSDEGPKLFTNKPKNLKASTPITTASSSSKVAAASPPPPPPPPPPSPPQPEGSFARRYKFYGKFLLSFSFITGAYFLYRYTLQYRKTSEEETPDRPASSSLTTVASTSTPAITEKQATPPILEPIQRPPIPEDQQRELFKWILEERRKVKPKDAEEKRQIDEEKAVLKQFIRAKSLPLI